MHGSMNVKNPCPRWDSNQGSPYSSCCRPTPQTARLLGSAQTLLHRTIKKPMYTTVLSNWVLQRDKTPVATFQIKQVSNPGQTNTISCNPLSYYILLSYNVLKYATEFFRVTEQSHSYLSVRSTVVNLCSLPLQHSGSLHCASYCFASCDSQNKRRLSIQTVLRAQHT